MNQTCQRFSGGRQPSRTPSTIFVHVMFLLDLAWSGYERGCYIAVTGDSASATGSVSPPGAEIERRSTSCAGRAPADGSMAGIVDCPARPVRPRKGPRDPDLRTERSVPARAQQGTGHIPRLVLPPAHGVAGHHRQESAGRVQAVRRSPRPGYAAGSPGTSGCARR
jgi:hypothetical protein